MCLPVCGPAVRPVVEVEKCVLLLESEPGLHVTISPLFCYFMRIVMSTYLVGGVSLHQLSGLMPVVELVGASIGVPALSEDKDVAVPAERIGEDGGRAEVDIAVVAWRTWR